MTKEAVDDPSHIVLHVAVVAAGGPLLLQAFRHLVNVVNLVDRDALIHVVQRLIVEVGVGVALRAEPPGCGRYPSVASCAKRTSLPCPGQTCRELR